MVKYGIMSDDRGDLCYLLLLNLNMKEVMCLAMNSMLGALGVSGMASVEFRVNCTDGGDYNDEGFYVVNDAGFVSV